MPTTIERKPAPAEKVVAVNRQAFHDYEIEERLEAGIALTGSEIKSVRAGRVNLRDAYARIVAAEIWLWNAHIAPYQQASYFGHEATRSRKLLLHREQIAYLGGKVKAKGYTLVPLRLYFKNHVAKIEVGLGRGKKEFDKRDTLAKREAQREIERALKREVSQAAR